ncbi:hypothetical protein P7D22_20910 [Lichenihabitans sp. Uapishka_5]|uniref:hypothetical protein n=1 Tax=Lichenihabitans sp. Uapishka_5 TaxID=3037302 RepID=UPI0029E8147D|nr:hypothetical protein [Lichenihabitans sp. Uapishka_5]MDX7953628.1 hypothetical protein [Lichenihabitans sp. Uapishka_5]
MLFWTRACLCVGVASVMAIQRLPPQARSPHLLPDGAVAATLAGHACQARPDLCAAAVTQGLGALAPIATRRAQVPPRRGPARDLPVALGGRSLT